MPHRTNVLANGKNVLISCHFFLDGFERLNLFSDGLLNGAALFEDVLLGIGQVDDGVDVAVQGLGEGAGGSRFAGPDIAGEEGESSGSSVVCGDAENRTAPSGNVPSV